MLITLYSPLRKMASPLHVLVYVDDLIIAGNYHDAIVNLKHYLSACFYMKDLEVLKYYLVLEVARGPEGLVLCQRKYMC